MTISIKAVSINHIKILQSLNKYSKKQKIIAAYYIFLFFCIFLAIHLNSQDVGVFLDFSILSIQHYFFQVFLCALFISFGIIVRGIRWELIIRGYHNLDPYILVAGFCWCFLLLQMTPFRLGEAVRPIWFKLKGGSGSVVIFSIIFERILDTLLLITILFTCSFSLGSAFVSELIDQKLVMLIFLACLVCLFFLILITNRHGKISQIFIGKRGNKTPRFTLINIPRTLTLKEFSFSVVVSIISWCLTIFGYHILLSNILEVDIITVLIIVVTVNLSSIITISPAQIGIFELVVISILSLVGVSSQDAIKTSLLLHFSIVVGQVVTGLMARVFLFIKER